MTFRPIATLAVLMATAVLIVGQLYMTIPLASAIAASYEVLPGDATLVGSAFGFAYAAVFLVFGALSDRYGRRIVLVGGLVGSALATLLAGLAPTFTLLLAARVLQGLAASTFPPAALSLVTQSLPPKWRPLGISLMSFAFLGAAPLAQLLAAQAGTGIGPLMLDLAPLYLVAALALACLVAPAATGREHASSGTGACRTPLRDPGLLVAWAAAATVLFGFVAFHAGALALEGADLQALRLAGLPPLLLTFAASPLTRRFGGPVTTRIGLILAALALALAALLPPALLSGASFLLGGGVALAVPGLIATVAGRASDATRGSALAIYSFALFLGASLAPPFAAATVPSGTGPLWLGPAALLLLAALGLTLARQPKRALA